MLYHLTFFMLSYTAYVLQVALAGRVAVDWLLLVGAAALMVRGDGRGVLWLAVCGLLGDCLSDGRLGVATGCAVLVGALVPRVWRAGPPRHFVAVAIWSFLIVFSVRWPVAVLRQVDAGRAMDGAALAAAAAVTAAVSAAVGLALWLAVRRVWRWMPGNEPKRRWLSAGGGIR